MTEATKPLDPVGEPEGPSANGATRSRKRGSASSGYTAESIQVLEGLEPVRRRPGMYIGPPTCGLHHLVWEVVDNSIDEAMAGFANRIEVTLLADGSVRNRDNGRGVPVGRHKTGKDALEMVHTVLHAGGKFGGGGYKVSGGLHGVGVSVVNALSAWLNVESERDGKVWGQGYERGKPTGPVRELRRSDGHGTTTVFMPDSEVFESLDCSFEAISQRLRESAYLNKGVWITLRDERETPTREKSFYFEGGLISFVRHLNKDKEVLHDRPVYVERKDGSTVIEVALQYNDGYAENVFSFANNINTVDGGTARDRLPRRADEFAQRLGAPRRRAQGVRHQPVR